jgi:hypothetical protein
MDGSPVFASQIGSQAMSVLDLAPGSTHTFQVTARDASGNTAQSNLLTVTTPAVTDTTPPSAPTNLALSSESAPPEIWLDWTQSTDDTDPPSQLMYDVYLNGVLDHAAMGIGETITYCPAAGPTEIVIRAVDASGNVSAPSNTIVFDC